MRATVGEADTFAGVVRALKLSASDRRLPFRILEIAAHYRGWYQKGSTVGNHSLVVESALFHKILPVIKLTGYNTLLVPGLNKLAADFGRTGRYPQVS